MRAIRRLQGLCLAVAVLPLVVLVAFSTNPPVAGRAATAAATCAGTTAACLSVEPQSDLVDGQFVKVTLSGFAAGAGIGFRQCIPTPSVIATDCTPVNQQVIAIADASGNAVTYLPVQSGSLLPTDGGKVTIACNATSPCVVAAMTTTTDLATAVYAPLSFARSRDQCPTFPNDGLLGAGSGSAYRAIYKWEFDVCTPPRSLSVDYTLLNSPDGISNMQRGITDFAVTGPLQQPPATDIGPTFRYAPLTTSAVVLAYRIYDITGPQVTNLTLTPDVIAAIFLGQIPNWAADSRVTSLNPGIQFPGRIVPFARAEHSAQTLVFTSWLAATAPSVWTAGAQDTFPFPPSQVQGKTGVAAVGQAVADPTTVFQDQGNIGFMDSSTAAFYGLPTVSIKQADGSVVAATPASITHAIVDSKVNSDGTLALDYSHPNATDYPMVMPTYMVAPTSTSGRLASTARGAQLAAFLRYAVQDGQGTLPPGYAPLPPSLVTESLAVAADIPAPPPATPTPTPTPTPRATAPPPVTQHVYQAPLTLPVYTPPTVQPRPAPAAAAAPCASTSNSPRPSPSASAAASASPRTTPPADVTRDGGRPTTTPSPCAAAVVVPQHRVTPAELRLPPIADATIGKYVLPLTAALAALSLVAGGGLEIVVWRRRWQTAIAAAGGLAGGGA